MTGRDPGEPHRSSTPLELLVDLCFVVAVAAAAAALHHGLSAGHWSSLLGYAGVFFGVWWAWVNYTWFASAYDTGDVAFRLGTFVVMTGVLVVAAGVPRAAGDRHDFGVLVVGYVVMRLALVPLWLRVAGDHPACRTTARRYATGIAVLQLLWVASIGVVGHGAPGWALFVVLGVAELATPWWAERAGSTPWHRHHVAERYEAFTIIVLGEVVLATSNVIGAALDGHGFDAQLACLVVGALLLVFSLWWAYFKLPMSRSLTPATAFGFGYAHHLVFASVAAVGAGLGVAVDVLTGHAHVSARVAVAVVAVAAGAYLATLSAVHGLADHRATGGATAIATLVGLLVVAVLGPPVGEGVLLLGAVVAGGLAAYLWGHRDRRHAVSAGR